MEYREEDAAEQFLADIFKKSSQQYLKESNKDLTFTFNEILIFLTIMKLSNNYF